MHATPIPAIAVPTIPRTNPAVANPDDLPVANLDFFLPKTERIMLKIPHTKPTKLTIPKKLKTTATIPNTNEAIDKPLPLFCGCAILSCDFIISSCGCCISLFCSIKIPFPVFVFFILSFYFSFVKCYLSRVIIIIYICYCKINMIESEEINCDFKCSR